MHFLGTDDDLEIKIGLSIHPSMDMHESCEHDWDEGLTMSSSQQQMTPRRRCDAARRPRLSARPRPASQAPSFHASTSAWTRRRAGAPHLPQLTSGAHGAARICRGLTPFFYGARARGLRRGRRRRLLACTRGLSWPRATGGKPCRPSVDPPRPRRGHIVSNQAYDAITVQSN